MELEPVRSWLVLLLELWSVEDGRAYSFSPVNLLLVLLRTHNHVKNNIQKPELTPRQDESCARRANIDHAR